MVRIDWGVLGAEFASKIAQTPGSKVDMARKMGLTRSTFYRVVWGEPLDTETYLTVCDWLDRSPNAFRTTPSIKPEQASEQGEGHDRA